MVLIASVLLVSCNLIDGRSVTYSVTGEAETTNINYFDSNGYVVTEEINIPWEKTVIIPMGENAGFSINASGEVNCRIDYKELNMWIHNKSFSGSGLILIYDIIE